jgi:8-oxo-dGTP pyrophosphatase MutT (NUDIX family)
MARRQRIAAYGVILDPRRHVLLVRAAPQDSGRWFLPGGGVKFGESPVGCLHREVEEETGQAITDPQLYRVMSDESHVDGIDLHTIRIIYRADLRSARPLRGERPGGSTVDLTWIPLAEAEALDLAPFVRSSLSEITDHVG